MKAQIMTETVRIYSASQDLLGRKWAYGRVVLFRSLGGTLRAPEPVSGYPEENCWQADLFGILRTGDSCDAAILVWARAAKASVPMRGTDGRPVCPYNGAMLAPGNTTKPAA